MISRQKSYYNEIASEIVDKINSGFYNVGEQLLSRNELCAKYQISSVTASRVQDALTKNGYAYKIKGKGMFVAANPIPKDSFNEDKLKGSGISSVKKIVCFCLSMQENRLQTQIFKIVHGIQRQALEAGIALRMEFLDTTQRSPAYNIDDDEGIIIVSSRRRDYLMPIIANPKAKAIVIENIFPEAYCVLVDNYSGIMQLLDFLESKKCKKMILATDHFCALGFANLSERNYAFENECKRRGLDYQIIRNGNQKELFEIIKKNKPDAVLFPADDPALKFKKNIAGMGLKHIPLVTGFDDWAPGTINHSEVLTTVKVNFEELGVAAVNVMLEKKIEDWHRTQIVRVPCQLIIRD